MEYNQNMRPGLLGGDQPGGRVRERLQGLGGGGAGPDIGQGGGMLGGLDMPDNPGPALAGRTPLVGSLRRADGMPVLRDQMQGQLGN